MTNKIKVDIVSDVVCPWCTVGYKRLEQAISELGIQDKVEIEWQPFELNPTMPASGQNLNEHMMEKYRMSTEQLKETQQRMVDAADDVNFDFDFHDSMLMVNTFEAHILLEYALEFDKQTDLKMHLMKAYFSDRKDVSDRKILKQALLDVGLNADEALAKLDNEVAIKEIKVKQNYWRSLGVTSVPTFVFNQEKGLTGAHPVSTLKKVFLEML